MDKQIVVYPQQWNTAQQVKRNKLLMHTTTWMSHNIIVLSERSQPKSIYWWLCFYKILENTNQSEVIEIRLVIAWGHCGWGQGRREKSEGTTGNFSEWWIGPPYWLWWWVNKYIHISTYQIARYKYVQFIMCQSFIHKPVKMISYGSNI